VEIDPNFYDGYNYRGLTYTEKKMYKEAIADFKKVTMLTKEPGLVNTVKQEIENLGG